MNELYPYLIEIIIWFFLLLRLINGRKIKYECAIEGGLLEIIFFILIGFLLWIKTGGLKGSLYFASCCMAAALYHILPGGFSDDAIYIKAKAYYFSKIEDMRLEEDGNKLRINFEYHHLTKVLISSKEHKDMIKYYIALYKKHN